MIEKIQSIVDYLNEKNDLFSDGMLVLNRNYLDGIDDSFINNFYITFQDSDENISFSPEGNNPCTMNYGMEYRLSLIAYFKCIDLDQAAKILLRQLKQYGSIIFTGISFDAYDIYEKETGEKLINEIQLIRIDFSYIDASTLNDCQDLNVCMDICC